MTDDSSRVYVFIKGFIRVIGALESMSGVVWISSRR